LYRDLTKEEREILEMLLEPNFPGSIELRVQLSSVKAKEIDEDGGLALQSVDGPEAPVRWRVPTEGECKDSDGGNVHILLHVLNGRMCELELYREDGSQVRRLPNARDLVLFGPEGEEGVKWKGQVAKVVDAGGPGLNNPK
jgi:hypothetical protein